ncbi:MAG: hypothetical protein Q9173_004342, partial [Seirophora scorigena]
MFPRLFPSRGPAVVERPTRRDADSTTNDTTFHDSRSSTGSSASIADVEACCLQGETSKRKEWEKACLPSTLLVKLRRSSSNKSHSPEKYKRRLSIGAFLALEIPRRASQPKNGVELIASRWGLPSSSTQQAMTTWPTDFSRDVQPIACHSHNDYWRRVPLYDALAAGCTGVEADIWTDANSLDDLF